MVWLETRHFVLVRVSLSEHQRSSFLGDKLLTFLLLTSRNANVPDPVSGSLIHPDEL